jgi:tRNA(fMet)-specific endonuclease VapC
MALILDTNALSAMGDGHPELEERLERAPELVIPAITLGEYKYGIRQSRNRTRYERWLAELIANCRILVVDEETADEYAVVRSELKQRGKPIPSNDVWIAALARQHAFPLLSRDQHFDSVPGLTRISW